MTSNTTTVRSRRSSQTSDRYGIFNHDRRTSGIFDRRLASERRQSQRRIECVCRGRRSQCATRRTQPSVDGNGAAVLAAPPTIPSIEIATA